MTRTLSGHLEDLDLDEIVRVIALSRRSGLLSIDAAEGKAELTFVGGRLVRTRLQDAQETVGDLLVRSSILEAADLHQAANGEAETLDDLVTRVGGARNDPALLVRVDDLLADQMAAAAARVMLFRSGSFHFRVIADDTPPLRYPRDTAVTLPAGADADELAREAKRRRLEKRADPLAALSAASKRAPASDHVELFLVSDDDAFLHAAERIASEAGLHAASIRGARGAIERFFALGASDQPAFMIVDLVMPRSTGKGILGGLEVLKRAADVDLAGRVFIALEAPHEDAEGIIRQLGGAGVVRKPQSLKLAGPRENEEPPLAAYLNPVLERLRRTPLAATAFDLAGELRDELGDSNSDWRAEGGRITDENIRSLETLKALLGELNDPSFDEEIPLLILRFASAFFVRGALFRIDPRAGELTGLGGFGLGVADPGRLVHSIKIPLAADTVFTRALKERSGIRQPFFDSEWNLRLMTALGGPRPRDVYTAPLISPRGVEVVIYADNATEQRAFPDIHLLEIFLQQSAAAIERATLKQQLKRFNVSA